MRTKVKAHTRIRPVTPADIPQILELGKKFHAESRYGHMQYQPQHIENLIAFVLTHPDFHCFLIAEIDAKVIGFIGGRCEQLIFSSECIAYDSVFYIAKEYRGYGNANLLINAFCDWAQSHDARELLLGISSGLKTRSAGKFYERLGFTNIGAIYQKNLK